MRRILALIWLSLSLAIASGPAFAVPSADCPKAHSSMADMADMPGNHEGMAGAHDGADCCTEHCSPDCAAVCPGTIMPPEAAAVQSAGPGIEQRAAFTSTMRRSAAPAASDPPPRTIFS
jgi:hypothetical protein